MYSNINEAWPETKPKSSSSETSFNPFTESEMYDPHFSPYATTKHSSDLSMTDSDTMDTLSDLDSSTNKKSEAEKCMHSLKHLKQCPPCNKKLKKIINKRVKSKYDDMILDYHKRQNIQKNDNSIIGGTTYENLKEIIILVMGFIIVLFVIYLIANMLIKK